MTAEAPRVAIIGASGIGKHHAKWWALEGARVTAFAGTAPQSVERTRAVLADLFGFDGRGYTSLEALLDAEDTDIVDICTPPACHYAHVRAALEAGRHVLCEKPFVYDPALPSDVLRSQALELVELAAAKGLRLSVATQYVAGARTFLDWWRQVRPDEDITHYHGHLESPAKGRSADPARVWVDLSPHPLSVLLEVVPGGRADWDSLRLSFRGYEAEARFVVERPRGQSVECVVVTRNAQTPPWNLRHVKLNGYPFVIEGEAGPDGEYRARIETPDGVFTQPDLMRCLIAGFLHGAPTVSPAACLANLDLMLRILDASRASRADGT